MSKCLRTIHVCWTFVEHLLCFIKVGGTILAYNVFILTHCSNKFGQALHPFWAISKLKMFFYWMSSLMHQSSYRQFWPQTATFLGDILHCWEQLKTFTNI